MKRELSRPTTASLSKFFKDPFVMVQKVSARALFPNILIAQYHF
jgi:hypothetical protein